MFCVRYREEDKSEDSVRPAKRKATRGRPKKKTVPNKPSDEEQLPLVTIIIIHSN